MWCLLLVTCIGGGNPSVHTSQVNNQYLWTWHAQYAHGMYMICTRHVHDMHMTCTWYAHDMYMICTWYVHDIHMICSLLILTTRNLRALKIRNWEILWGKVVSRCHKKDSCCRWQLCMLHCFVGIKPFRFCQLYANSCTMWFAISHL